jgi:prepilin-type N-terminal cleavage/methylation domain-containing protein
MGRGPPPVLAGGSASDDGFTLIEVLVASVVLVVGLLGVLTLLSGAIRTTRANRERVGATNLTRRLIEATRALDYDDMAGALVQARLQAGGMGAGSPWTYVSGATTYTIVATSCTYDDPADKLASPRPDRVCLPQPIAPAGDSNGDDFRRTTFQVSWPGGGGGGTVRSVTQTTLVGNPSGGLGPRIVSFTPVTQTITTTISSVAVDWTTTSARSLRWVVDDGASAGSSTGSTSFTSTWAIGSSGSRAAGEVLDGAYQITAQPFDDRDIAGEVKQANVVLNRREPYAPTAFAGGHDTRAGDWVDLQWAANRERDILGYRVVRAGLLGDVQVCPGADEGSMLAPTTSSCADRSPTILPATYHLVAIDRAADNQPRDGDRATLLVGLASLRPTAPTALTVQTAADGPRLAWNAPAAGSVQFYRVYRDGSAFADRYDRTAADVRTFTDTSAGSGAHTYWVTAVNGSFNESTALGPVTSP